MDAHLKGYWHVIEYDLHRAESAGGIERLLWSPLSWALFNRWVSVWSAAQ